MSGPPGEMAEWSIATVLKTVSQQWLVGSNPTLSLPIATNPATNQVQELCFPALATRKRAAISDVP